MITITNTIIIAITIAITIIITIAITIAIAIISISLRLNAHTYGHNQWEVGTRFRCKIWICHLLSPSLNCLPFLRNRRLRLSTPWPWGIVRSPLSGRTTDKVQTMTSTVMMIRPPYAARHLQHTTCHMPPTKHCPPYATCLTLPAAWFRQLSKSLDRACRRVHVSI